jgi:hypothetical protein
LAVVEEDGGEGLALAAQGLGEDQRVNATGEED